MLISEHLDRAAQLLAGPNAWCQGSAARREDGRPAAMGSPEAVSHCLDGAMYEISLRKDSIMTMQERMMEYKAAVDFLNASIRVHTTVINPVNGKKESKGIILFNDDANQTQDKVVAFVKMVADEARAEYK